MTRTATIEQSPEEVLARLEQYAASVGVAVPAERPQYVTTAPEQPTRAAAAEATLPVPTTPAAKPEIHRIILEAAGYAVLAVCTVLAVLVYQAVDETVASVILLVFIVGGAIATARRMPLALWWTLGFAIGGLLARLS